MVIPMTKVMLVEDNLIFRDAFKSVLLQRFPLLDVDEAADEDEALLIASFFQPDLIFVDITLRRGNGLDLTRAIKSSGANTVIVMLSSHDLPEYRSQSQQCGADHFFSKSAPLEEVLALVEGLICPCAKVH
jgi:two-component system OmpR family response regulator